MSKKIKFTYEEKDIEDSIPLNIVINELRKTRHRTFNYSNSRRSEKLQKNIK